MFWYFNFLSTITFYISACFLILLFVVGIVAFFVNLIRCRKGCK